MPTTHLTIRPAAFSDAPFVAECVYAALGEDFRNASAEEKRTKLMRMTTICEQEDTLYSWRNTYVAVVGEKLAGALVSYEGARYADLRKNTFQRLGDLVSVEAQTMVDETVAGEYYLDSLAVMPEFRRQGIARELLLDAISRARTYPCNMATLVVIPDSMAMQFYKTLGFRPENILYLFGEDYLRMTYPLS
ncbi:MAG: GNAT family N-acetyltransferase [Paludibacter sp.]|nr:GNAT family N-acetyltransferase [Bacteroidales bacterium]MCM1069476.1 GNAT family N-acetyltransferase [Prevotella sp.]MCM1354132.1 GNAT family N-acetyltransferase [Bacteroides sp.]MCM1443011.1 GNAT family N-acetyltransferase [Muribaculum sp.]MCM1482207.1 GNAT family N-acetyltransferase [Paludibacter sp.]